MYPILFFLFLMIYFGLSLVFLHILGPQDVSYVVRVVKASSVEWKMKNQVNLPNRAD